MKALVQDHFGPPSSLRLEDVDEPRPGPGEVVVEVHASSLNPYDWHMLRGDPRVARLMGGPGMARPRHRVAGADVAGVVVEVGPGVDDVTVGDEVVGYGFGAFAERVATPARLVVPKPPGLSMAEAATLPTAGTTGVRAVRDVGGVLQGDRVLVNGAAGGVGSMAVQAARSAGAEVVAVCSAANADLALRLGASRVVAHDRDDITRDVGGYDVVLDNVGNHGLRAMRRLATADGTLCLNAGLGPGRWIGAVRPMLTAALLDRFVRQRLRPVPTRWDGEEVRALVQRVPRGAVRPVLEDRTDLAGVPQALARLERGHTRGKVAVVLR